MRTLFLIETLTGQRGAVLRVCLLLLILLCLVRAIRLTAAALVALAVRPLRSDRPTSRR